MSCCRKRFSWYFTVVLLLVWCAFLPSFYAETTQDTSSVSDSGKVMERPKQNLDKEIEKDVKDTEARDSLKEHALPDESPQTISTPAITLSVDDLLGDETISKESITGLISETVKRMGKIPADVKDDSPEGKIRSALKRQNEILKELLTTVESREKILSQRKSLTLKKEELEIKTREFEALGPVHLSEEPTREKLELQQTKLELNRNTLSQLKEEANIRAKRIEKLPEFQDSYAEQGTSLDTAIQRLSTELSVAKEGTDKQFLILELENAKLENRVVRESLLLLDNELLLEKEFPHLRSEWIDYAQRVVTRSEEEYDLYQKAMSSLLAKEKEVLKAELEEKKQATESAKTHSEQFLAAWEEKIARINAFKSDLEAKKAILSNMVIQQEKRIQTEKDNFESMTKLISKLGTGGRGGERIKMAYRRIRELRKDPQKIFGPPVAESLAKNRTRLFEIDELIFEIAQTWNQQFESVISAIPPQERSSFEKQAQSLREDYRNVLLEEQNLLADIVSQESEIQNLGIKFNDIISDLEEFILPRLFWIRDAESFGVHTPGYIVKEVIQILRFARDIFAMETVYTLTKKLKSPLVIFLELLIFVILPFVLIYTSVQLKRFLRTEQLSRKPGLTNFFVFISIVRYPVYLILVSFLIRLAGLPTSIDEIVSGFIFHFAIFLFLEKLSYIFLVKKTFVIPYFKKNENTAKTIHISVSYMLYAYIIILAPSIILKGSPLMLDTIPRIGYNTFCCIALVSFFRLIRRSSSLVQDIQKRKKADILYKHWTSISGFTILVLFGTGIMDAMGFRFGASWIAIATLCSFFTVIVFDLLYQTARNYIRQLMKRRIKDVTAAPGSQPQISLHEVEKQILSFTKMFFVLLGVFLFAVYWGINERVFNALDKVILYSIHGVPPEFVSIADAFKCVIIFVITLWILRHISGIYEIGIFPWVRFDAGLRYAIVTISRYGVFFIGSLIALSAIQLSLSKLSWLMAAIGFGLGFGMQEIFSNFVSGIILLLERPVRVGDTVKVGEFLGNITRINIRATTITNFDRLENIIPNKDFITKGITNWTLQDKVTRLIIKIGVAYGSNIDEVRQLLIDIANQQPEIMKDPPPSAFFLEHGDSTLNFELRFFVPDTSYRLPLTDRMNTLINKEFTARGIVIAYPQRDVHLIMENVPENVKKLAQDVLKKKEPFP